jgi:AraC-like DNA-binding protein
VKNDHTPQKINSISELHRMLGLPKPLHPLVSLVDNTRIAVEKDKLPTAFLFNFYKISYKTILRGKIRYGQNYYDFDEGGLVFTAPNQILAITDDTEYFGSTLLIHPDFIRNYPLGENIKKFGFFSYDTNEALHLSEKEKVVILNIFRNIEDELQSTIDDFSQDVIIAQIELLLNYSNRFYKRQFLTRKAVNNDLLSKLEHLLDDYFDKESAALTKGLPTVQYLAAQLNVSPRYLSDMLRSLTGQNAQQHIHNKLIEKAKEMLSASNLSVAEVAYQLGFEYPQSFNKLFKRKTNLSPLEFRESFN